MYVGVPTDPPLGTRRLTGRPTYPPIPPPSRPPKVFAPSCSLEFDQAAPLGVVTMIPRSTAVSNLRPIALVTVVQKCTSRVFLFLLENTIVQATTVEQTCFIQGRSRGGPSAPRALLSPALFAMLSKVGLTVTPLLYVDNLLLVFEQGTIRTGNARQMFGHVGRPVCGACTSGFSQPLGLNSLDGTSVVLPLVCIQRSFITNIHMLDGEP